MKSEKKDPSGSLFVKLDNSLLCKREAGIFFLYSPVYNLDASISDSGVIESNGYSISTAHFINRSFRLHDDKLRMLRYAFLKPVEKFMAVNLEISTDCSMNCRHCFVNGKKNTLEKGLFPLSNVSKLLQLNPQEVSITGGEIFLVDNLAQIIGSIDEQFNGSSEYPMFVKLLASGNSFRNSSNIEKLFSVIHASKNCIFQFRITLFDIREQYHDFICGSSGNFRGIIKFITRLKIEGIDFSINFPVLKTNIDVLDDAILWLEDNYAGRHTFSSIIYRPGSGITDVAITPQQFGGLVANQFFSNMISQYIASGDQCDYNCNFPLLNNRGELYSCNLPGSCLTGSEEEVDGFRNKSRTDRNSPEICAGCECAGLCKRCPHFIPDYKSGYCDYVHQAFKIYKKNSITRMDEGFFPIQDLLSGGG